MTTATPRQVTPEQQAEQERRQVEARERANAQAEQYRKAKERAEGFLYENLTDQQRAEIKRSKFFVVRGGKTGHKYKINVAGGISGNVHELDDAGAIRQRWCAHLQHAANAPEYDHYLAQKLMLEHHEDEFLRVANAHGR